MEWSFLQYWEVYLMHLVSLAADYMLSRTAAALKCTEQLEEACGQYLADRSGECSWNLT